MKVGGHQASSASLVTAMTALWFAHLDGEDRVAVKPHASPVFHAIQYLLGNLDRSYLPRLRARGGLQSYPSRTKDPDGVDFSTGSVGHGAAAPLFAAVTRRYVDAHFGERPRSRFVALIGDAELDEGNIWEAVADPATTGLGNVMWLVDFNRQSLDRVVPGVRINQWRGQFEAAGWHVVEVKYGRRLAQAYARPGGEVLRDWIDLMPNEQYQSLFGLTGPDLRERFLDGAPAGIAEFIADIPDDELGPLVTDLGGHDLEAMLDAYAQCDAVTDRPSVVFAYTVKGWRLPIAGNPRNHSALLTTAQVDALRAAHGLTPETEWDRLDPASPAGIRAGERREALSRAPRERALPVTVPETTRVRANKPVSTQEVFGRVLASAGGRRGVPAGGRARGVPAPGRRPGGAARRVRGGAAGGARRGGRAGRRGHRGARRRRDLARPALPGLAADAAPGSAHGHRAERPRGAAVGLRRPGARGDRARRRVPRDGLARLGPRRARGAARGGRVRPVRQRPGAVRAVRPAARQHRQRRPGGAVPALSRGVAGLSRGAHPGGAGAAARLSGSGSG
ncbi:hypothetical protein GCM10010429_56810 [Micromonospora olivasterospora]|uniref:Transketolase-like protein n=1 Tax=Micromonospora olivasterospora TaxID=1880 RepID=A0A562ICM6_MICOL|nr:transketolase-like protein [Micromonospora olivasterospora]